jgi:DNA-binding winged helix-turn-helix (wHTH) protein/Tol biopolymer transport system component
VLDSSRYPVVMDSFNRSSVIQFGAFEADLRAGELRKNGLKVRIQQQPFEVLMALVARPGEVISRDELRTRLWPDDTFVDFDHGLNAAVKRLRDALGESAENPIFIETLAKRGYRFAGHLNGNHPALTLPVEGSRVLPGKHHGLYKFAITTVGIFILVIAIGTVLFLRTRLQPAPERLESRLTANSPENPVTGAAISPDGNYVAYSDPTGLYLKLISTGETHPVNLPNDFFAMPVSWFPDGAHLLIDGGKKSNAERGLWSISIYGGLPRKLMDSALTGSVSPDGQHIAFLRGTSDWGDVGSEIWTTNSDGNNPIRLVSPINNGAIGTVVWATDSAHLAYTLSQWGGHTTESATIEIVSTAGSVRHTVLSNRNLGPALHWLPDGRLIYTLREERPNQRDSNAWEVQIDAHSGTVGSPVRLTRSFGWISSITSSSDGKHLALLKDAWSGHVFLGRLAPDQNQISNVRRMTLEESQDLPTSWTADSKSVLFSSDRNGHAEIFKQAVDQTQPELLVAGAESTLLPRLSPDGSEVLYLSAPQDSPKALGSVRATPVNGGISRKIFEVPGLGMGNVECTRKPTDFCVVHSIDGERLTFYRFDPRTGVKSQLTHIDTDSQVNWGLSPDGAYLAILPYSPDSGSMSLYRIADGRTTKLDVKEWTGLTTVDWAADSKSMFVGTLNRAGRIALLRVTLDGNAHVLREGTFPTLCGCAYWAIPSPDGKWVAINEPAGSSNVWGLDTK